MAVKQPHENPFITLILPFAYTDDLLMHTVLATSGIHLSGRTLAASELVKTTWQHCQAAVMSLRSELQNATTMSRFRRVRLVVVLMMLCHFEALSGNEEGAIFHHLNASRHLLESILASNEASLTKDSRDLEGFAFEVNAYLALVVDIAPFVDAPPARKIPQDSFITSLQYLQKYDTFGAFFSCGYPLFEKISAITLLFNKRLAEEERRVLCSEGITSSYLSLQESILAWKSSPPSHDMERWKSEHLAAGELYRRALLIYLNAALYGSVIDHLKAIGELQEHAEIGLEHIELMWASPYKAIMLWPLMMVGSCLLSKSHRDRIRLDFETDASDLIHVRKACKLITWLWEHKDRRAYGPFGLHFVMEERGVHYCLA